MRPDAAPVAPAAPWKALTWIPTLEPLRGVAALAVVLCHVGQQTMAHDFSLRARVVDMLGNWGVSLFFVLSGFCIHLPIARRLHADAEHRVDWRRFFKRRARRLLPTHYASLVLSAVVATHFTSSLVQPATVSTFVQHVLMVHVFTAAFFTINGVFWSIAIEVHFYLAYPLLLVLRRRLGSGATVLALAVVGVAIYGAATVLMHEGPMQLVARRNFVTYWSLWAAGAWLADVYVTRRQNALTRIMQLPFAPVVWCLATMAVVVADPVVLRYHASALVEQLTLTLFVGSLLVRDVTLRGPLRGLATVGLFSYSLYLVHPVVLAIAPHLVPVGMPVLYAAVAVPACVATAWLFFLAFERPFLSARAAEHAPSEAVLTAAAPAPAAAPAVAERS